VKKPTAGEGIRSDDGLANVDAGPPKEREGVICGCGGKVVHFTEPLASSRMAVMAGTCKS
jgi:hypothetical protein